MTNVVHTHNGKCLPIKNMKEVLSHACRTLSENTYKHHSFPLKWMWILSNLKRKKGLISKEQCLPDAERGRQVWLVGTEDRCIIEMPSNILRHNWIVMVDNKYLFQEDWAERILYILSTNQLSAMMAVPNILICIQQYCVQVLRYHDVCNQYA